ncbi:MAG TPA: type VI secretion protein IcmF/TssM N-terminal domain-containing protein, partial [Bryobacteraceae bacterium]|nr:type VI secretion protein IcmF/TssM N-terminal domain-containing protein [Bryobacteraceae bacterium]
MAGQITIRRLFGLVLLFLFFETIVWILAALLLPDTSPLLVCGVMTGLALAVWVVYALTTRWFMRPHPVATPAPVTRQAPAPPSLPASGPIDGELEEARRLYDEAAARLAGSPAFAGRQSGEAIRELPLFLVAGAEGSGKTTVLLHCGMEGQLLAGQVQRDAAVIPTRAWNLWYGGGALFADVSGRIFSDEGGRWAGLLQIATNSRRKHLLRRLWEGDLGRRTLRGVILVLNAAEFLHNPDPQKTAATARRCQDRLRAIAQRFGVSFPVYVLFTRADAIPYFGDYFARLSEQEDQRILGCTLSPQREAEGGPQQIEVETKRLNNAFTTVYQSLADKRLTMLARESMTSRRPNVYEFPREFKRIRSEVVRFLVDVFRPSPLERGPVLRGFYFTGVRQVASATQLDEIPVGATVVRGGIDATGLFRPGDFSRSIARQSHTRAETPSPVLPRWAFLAELFRKVIVADQPMASQMVVMDPRLQRLRRYGLIAVTALSALASFCFAASWMNNRRLLEDVRSAAITSASPTGGSSLLQALEAMEPLRAKLALLRQYDRDGAPLRLRWGLYSGERVEQDLRRAYFERFREVFLTPTLTAIDQSLSQLDSPSDGPAYSQAYNYLKSYRMMTSGRCKPETNPLAQVFSEAWRGGRSLDTRTEELAGLQMSFYVSELQRANPYSISEDAAAVERGQRYLSGFGGAARIYRSILEDVNRSGTPPARLASLAPNYEDVLSGPGEVPASFTRGAWN